MHKLTSFKYLIYPLTFTLSITNTYAQNIYLQNDILNINKCTTRGWCKISNSQSWIKSFRLKKLDDNTYKIIAKGKTYTYTIKKELSKNQINKLEKNILIINDKNIKRDFDYGYVRNTLIHPINNIEETKKEEITSNKIVEKLEDTLLNDEKIDDQINTQNKLKTKVKLNQNVQQKKQNNTEKDNLFIGDMLKNNEKLDTQIKTQNNLINNIVETKKEEVISNKIVQNLEDILLNDEKVDDQIKTQNNSKNKLKLEEKKINKSNSHKYKNIKEKNQSNIVNNIQEYNKQNIFQSISFLYENYDINRIDINNINHPYNASFPGIGYKIGQERNNYRYYANARITSGLEVLISADYLSTSNIFAGLSVGYGGIKLNSNSTYIKGTLYGLQVGYRFKRFEFTFQQLKNNMKITNNFVDYSIEDLNYFLIDYRF